MEVSFIGLLNVIAILGIRFITHLIVPFINNNPHFSIVKIYAVRKLEAILSCVHCVTRNVATGSSTQHVTPHG